MNSISMKEMMRRLELCVASYFDSCGIKVLVSCMAFLVLTQVTGTTAQTPLWEAEAEEFTLLSMAEMMI